jgi:NAD(P)-dependent dehydrogenase (short-subunit alcohol dehydrogenase family)
MTTALITGATSGIGRAAADKLAQSGVHVMVVGRNVERGEKTIAEIRAAGGKADFISSDLRDAASARAVARKALELGGGHIDILINNAGVFPFGPTHEMTERSFDDVYALNVKAPYFLVAELAPLMAQRGKGAIINVSTMVADYGAAGLSLYGSSKAAINLLTKAWAAEYGPKGVRVNAVSPGPTRTEGTAAMGDALQQLAAQAPAGRPAAPEEIAEAIVFLATDRASEFDELAEDHGRSSGSQKGETTKSCPKRPLAYKAAYSPPPVLRSLLRSRRRGAARIECYSNT